MPRILTTADETSWDARMVACEGAASSLSSRMTAAEGTITGQASSINSLNTRMSTAESTLSSAVSNIASLGTRTSALETWRGNKAAASPDVATDVITLGLAAPRASSINAIINTIMGEVNGLKAILRAREILAA